MMVIQGGVPGGDGIDIWDGANRTGQLADHNTEKQWQYLKE